MIRGFFLSIATLYAVFCQAQQAYPPETADPLLEQWRWSGIPELYGQGLKNVAEAPDGSIWFYLNDKIARYDGLHWQAFPFSEIAPGALPGFRGGAIGVSPQNEVYIGTDKAIYRYGKGKWEKVFPANGFYCPVYDLVVSGNGALWAGTPFGLLRWDKGQATLFCPRESIPALERSMPGVSYRALPDSVPDRHRYEGPGCGIYARDGDVVVGIAPGSPAEQAGLRVGDKFSIISGVTNALSLNELRGEVGVPALLRVLDVKKSTYRTVQLENVPLQGASGLFPVFALMEDKEGGIWCGLWHSGRWVRVSGGGPGPYVFENQWQGPAPGLDAYMPVVFQAGDGAIWTGSWSRGAGVYRFGEGRRTGYDLRQAGGDNEVHAFVQGPGGSILASGRQGAIMAYRDGAWGLYRHGALNLPHEAITLFSTSGDRLWVAVGTRVFLVDLGERHWETYLGLHFQYQHAGTGWFIGEGGRVVARRGGDWQAYNEGGSIMDYPHAIRGTREGRLWMVGTHGDSIATALYEKGGWTRKLHMPITGTAQSYRIFQALDGAIWFTLREDGLLRYKGDYQDALPTDWERYAYPDIPHGVNDIGQTADSALWLAGFRTFLFKDGQAKVADWPEALSYDMSNSILTTPENEIWIGTLYGIFHYDGKNWQKYDTNDGLADNAISNLLYAWDGTVWAVSNNGISRFDGQRWVRDALPPGVGTGELLKAPDSTLWINSENPFRTVRLVHETAVPDTRITLHTRQVTQPGNTVIAWEGNDAWGATDAGSLLYSYRLNNDSWSPFLPLTSYTFLDLPDGDHVFEVRARDLYFNIDPTPARVAFTVLPPIYKQAWFILLIAIFIGTITLLIGRILVKNKRIHELDMIKLRLFTNISHDLKTPLTLILAPLEKLLRYETYNADSTRKQLRLIFSNAKRMGHLVNEIMDFRKIETGKMKLEVAYGDIVQSVRKIAASFNGLASERRIDLQVNSTVSYLSGWYDMDKLEKIMFNLLSNAFRFTADHGQIHVGLSSTGKNSSLVLTIKDDGIGIPPNKQKKIFERYYKVYNNDDTTGSGIGLSIVKELVELHHGAVVVSSTPGQGSAFQVTLPIARESFSAIEIKKSKPLAFSPNLRPGKNRSSKTSGTVLIVEDNEDMRVFLRNELSETYKVYEANNGHEGFELATKKVPDLVISDIVMPKMNGVDMCKKIKDDERTCHTPIMLLTSGALEEFRLKGLQVGADAYMEKPFRIDELKYWVSNMIASRNVLKQKVEETASFPIQRAAPVKNMLDEEFLINVAHETTKHLADPAFNVDMLASELGISRRHLLKKIKELTGQSAIEYIRSAKMQKAAELILEARLTISQIVYEVGFQDSPISTKFLTNTTGQALKNTKSDTLYSTERFSTDRSPTSRAQTGVRLTKNPYNTLKNTRYSCIFLPNFARVDIDRK